jgi:threonine dehydratase
LTQAAAPSATPASTLAALQAAARSVHAVMPPTPQYRWPLLEQAFAATPGDGTEVWLKHENHTPVGAFKIRGGLVFFERLAAAGALPRGVVSATRGNHGQSIALAAARHGVPALIVVPHGNSREKNAAMRALGAEVVEHGDDFQAAREHAQALAARRGWAMVPSFHPDLVAGVASYALELFGAAPWLHTVYVPIGLGSGACGLIAARDALGLATQIVGVVSNGAPAYALSLAAGRLVAHAVTTTLADGVACSTPEPDALAVLQRGLARVVSVSDAEVAQAMRQLFEATHQVAEGAGAAALAAAWQERAALAGHRTALVLSGGNVDRDVFARVLAGAPA